MIRYINRLSGNLEVEKVFGEKSISFITGKNWFKKLTCQLIGKFPLFSAFYGQWQKAPWTKHKIKKFIIEYGVDDSEFEKKTSEFNSFNDFFIRRLKPSSRPISKTEAVIPADGRFLFYPNIAEASGFVVKNQKFSLETLLQDKTLADRYAQGSLVIGRLCPVDYHRFHFPCDGAPSQSNPINGSWFSVNPMALRKNIHILTQNKRTICELETSSFGNVLVIEVGATNVGSIIQTYQPGSLIKKGDEKGYFSFGASALILLFEPGVIQFSDDLLQHPGMEIRCLMGQPMGTAISS